MPMRRRTFLLATAGLVVGVSGCAGREFVPLPDVPSAEYSHKNADSMVPDQTLEDWATYGDYLLFVTVESEKRDEPTAEELKDEEGLATRRLTIAIDQDPVWTRPTLAAKHDIPPTETIVNGAYAWYSGSQADKPERRISYTNAPWMVVGGQYLYLVLFSNLHLYHPTEEPDRVQMLFYAGLALDNGIVAPDTMNYGGGFAALAGKNLDQVKKTLDQQPVFPGAEPYMDIDPIQRHMDATS